MDWIHDEGCAARLGALCVALVAALIALGGALGYLLRWLTHRGA